MPFVDECLESYFQGLDRAETCARLYWRHLTGQGPMPSHRDYGLNASQAQAVRIKLAGLK